ncbi:MAG: four helix bundle protein [Tenuifilaceae bacterium]|nr:four helix bundle protein [Rikenellaceae bacterium]
MAIERFEEIEIWQEARPICKYIGKLTSKDTFKLGIKLCDQIRSSSGSIMDNVAEGFGRGGNKEFLQFLYIAKGSCNECRSQGFRAFDYEYITEQELDIILEKTESISKKITALINYLKKDLNRGTKY